jgi:hypothetical protein
MDISTEFEKLKQKIEKQKANQKKAYTKYYENNKNIIIQKVKEYNLTHKKDIEDKPKRESKMTEEQKAKKKEYNKRYQYKLKQKKLLNNI